MILLEDHSIEQDVLAGNAYIAIPIEIYQDVFGQIEITVYSALRGIAEAYISTCGENPFQTELLSRISQHVEVFMNAHGYKYNAEVSQTILEFTISTNRRAVIPLDRDIIAIKTQDEWMRYANETNADCDFFNENPYIAFAAVKNERIVSCACINDAFYANGAAEIYVETIQEYRNRGLGASCAAALVSYLTERGIPVWYKCYETNSASVAVAKKCGLELAGKRKSFVYYANA